MPALNPRFGNAETVRPRRSQRRTLQLSALAVSATDGTADTVDILNLSERGFLMHSETEFILGDVLEMDLAGAETCEALIVWNNAPQYGCQFATPLPKAAVSASLLRSPALRGEISRPLAPSPAAVPSPETSLPQTLPSADDRVAEGQDGLSARARLGLVLTLAALSWTPIVAAIAILRG
ncbi:PilZ domain-containing protein [Novosphingobium aerophilum]|uniref:PilZ domain-containing protein n=1 Tax=Novosphingobium aerophilum TaxID=2839843 RepID=A0A7X1F7S6_9SPHN|nr:PilZ domain-containing protein [Novosphingobium aerophilum]MBC2651943.1 PilZ domain-containing protein [Novosphingobium aerophilum]